LELKCNFAKFKGINVKYWVLENSHFCSLKICNFVVFGAKGQNFVAYERQTIAKVKVALFLAALIQILKIFN